MHSIVQPKGASYASTSGYTSRNTIGNAAHATHRELARVSTTAKVVLKIWVFDNLMPKLTPK